MRPGYSRAASLTSAGSRTAAVPMMTRSTPFIEPGRDGCEVADAAAELDRERHAFKNALDGAGIHRMARKGAVEIDHMQIFKPCCSKLSACAAGSRLNTVARAISPCSRRTHTAVFKIDGGKQDQGFDSSPHTRIGHWANQGFHLRKLAINASPSFWLFSGWNWVPA